MKFAGSFFSIITISFVISTIAWSSPYYLPMQDHSDFDPVYNPTSITQFKVLIFPHLGPYPIPQGREDQIQSVEVRSPSGCKRFEAQLNDQQEWQKVGHSIEQITVAKFSKNQWAQNRKFFYFECDQGFELIRSAKENFKYPNDFVVGLIGSELHVINIVDPETYLKGVVPTEVPASWPIETLKAQAVAARTYAWWSVQNNRLEGNRSHFDMDDTVQYQAYLGTSRVTATTDEAVRLTKSQVMLHDQKIIKAYFSADSGGHTESAKNFFGEVRQYCHAVPEQYNTALVASAWNVTLPLERFKEYLKKLRLMNATDQIQSVTLLKENVTESGRALKLSVLLKNQKLISLKAADFRYEFKLRSTLFSIKVVDQNVAINGLGYGHGVGLSQVGALHYVKQLNWRHDQILKFYYNGISISE